MRSEAEILPPTAREVREVLEDGPPAGMSREQIELQMALRGRGQAATTLGIHKLIQARRAHWRTPYGRPDPADVLQLGPRPEDSTL